MTEDFLAGTDQFVVSLTVGSDNRISIFIDGDSGVTIDDCVALSRHIENSLDRDKDDFELNVSSAGIGQPFVNLRQYLKNIGKPVEIILNDGNTLRGILRSADDEKISLAEEVKRKNKKSKKMIAGDEITINMAEIAKAKAIIIF